MPSRNFYCIYSDDLPRSRDWYVHLFNYRVEFDSDWFISLQARDNTAVELAILSRSHEIVPERFRSTPAGGMLTIVIEDVDATHRVALDTGVEIVEEPKNLFYGQRRMLVLDPNGLLVDVSSECPPDPDWLATLER